MDKYLVFATIGIVVATFISPVLALQVQKWLEESREKKRRKMWIFNTLMMTRATRMAPDHVRALNAIDLAFNGTSKKEKDVVDAWRIYFDHLNQFPKEADEFPKEADEPVKTSTMKQEVWQQKCDDLFVILLKRLSGVFGYPFDEVQLKRGFYYPKGHGDVELFQQFIKGALINIMTGKASIPMNITGFPSSKEALDLQQKLNRVFESLAGGALQITVNSKKENKDFSE